MLLWTLNKRWQLLPLHPPLRRAMNCPTVRLSPSVTRGSGAQRPSSNPHSWEWNHAVSMKPPTTPSWNAMLTSGRTCMPTQFCPEEPPCTPELLTACKRKSLLWLHLPWKLRLLLLQKGNTLSGSEVPSWLRYPPSNRCGFPNRNMTSPVLLSFIGSASKNVATPPPFFDSCVFKKRIFHSNYYLHFWINYHSCKMSLLFFWTKTSSFLRLSSGWKTEDTIIIWLHNWKFSGELIINFECSCSCSSIKKFLFLKQIESLLIFFSWL